MASDLKLSIARLTDSARCPRAPSDLPVRLRLLAALLRDAPTGMTDSRVLWREASGSVRAVAVCRRLVFGRDPHCDIILGGARVSRWHCVLEPLEDGVVLRDLRSANGTFVNGARLERCKLRDGDLIEMGGAAVVFVAADEGG